MGLFSFLENKEDKLEAKMKASTERGIKEMMDVFARGGSAEEAMEAAMRPHNFHECRGGLSISAVNIFPIIIETLSGNEVDEETRRHFWDDFVRYQKYCDEFFFGCEMRTYVIARAWKQEFKSLTWDKINFISEQVGIGLDIYRKEDWWRVACFEHLADKGHEDREDFQSAWRSMTAEDRRAVVYSLDSNQINFYKLQE